MIKVDLLVVCWVSFVGIGSHLQVHYVLTKYPRVPRCSVATACTGRACGLGPLGSCQPSSILLPIRGRTTSCSMLLLPSEPKRIKEIVRLRIQTNVVPLSCGIVDGTCSQPRPKTCAPIGVSHRTCTDQISQPQGSLDTHSTLLKPGQHLPASANVVQQICLDCHT